MKLVKNIIAVVAILVMILALYVSYTEPVKSEVIRKEGTFGSATWDVTYQPKNIYGIAIGEEYTVTELTPYWKDVIIGRFNNNWV